MIDLKIIDDAFSHVPSCCVNNISDNINWLRNVNIMDGDTLFFTDGSLSSVDNFINRNINKIAWLIEPPAILASSHNYIKNNYDKFDTIFTYEKSLLDISDKFKYLPIWCSWIKSGDKKIHTKSKSMSIIASHKRDTNGHRLRHDIIKDSNGLDLYGREYNPIDDKIEALGDYKFSIVIENYKSDLFFSEKLIDCLVSGTIPIYWGANKIGDFFNKKGMIIFNTKEEALEIINNINKYNYDSMLPYIEENFKIAMEYPTIEDYLYKNYKDII
jgi:hypothetical protein